MEARDDARIRPNGFACPIPFLAVVETTVVDGETASTSHPLAAAETSR